MFMPGLLPGGTLQTHFHTFISDPSEPTQMNAESATIVKEFLSHSGNSRLRSNATQK